MQAIKLCFAGVCGGRKRKDCEDANEALVSNEEGKKKLRRLMPSGDKPKLAIGAATLNTGRHDVVERKLIFLDVDGPLAPWRNGREHQWSRGESLDSQAYCNNVDALMRIINSGGGPDVVKVVITSNWRTDPDKYPWLIEQMGKRGIDVVGHTDVMRAHPPPRNHSIFERTLEIRRVLEQRIVGTKGPCVAEDGTNAFEAIGLPENWAITAWIAIDDLDLASSGYDVLKGVQYLRCCMPVPSDPDVEKGWMSRPENFVDGTYAWLMAFAASHFVRVGSTNGIAGTTRAEDRAIKFLQTA